MTHYFRMPDGDVFRVQSGAADDTLAYYRGQYTEVAYQEYRAFNRMRHERTGHTYLVHLDPEMDAAIQEMSRLHNIPPQQCIRLIVRQHFQAK